MESFHLIEKVLVDVTTNSTSRANELKGDATEFIKNRVLPIIEKIFDEKTKDWSVNDFILIEHLEVDIDYKDAEWGEVQLERKLEHEIDRLIDDALRRSNVSSTSQMNTNLIEGKQHQVEDKLAPRKIQLEDKTIEGWLFFINTGMRPWWAADVKTFNTSIREDNLLVTLGEVVAKGAINWPTLLRGKLSLNRLIAQYSDEFLAQFCLYVLDNSRPSSAKMNRAEKVILKLKEFKNDEGKKVFTRPQFWQVLFSKLVLPQLEKQGGQIEILEPFVQTLKKSDLSKKSLQELADVFSELIPIVMVSAATTITKEDILKVLVLSNSNETKRNPDAASNVSQDDVLNANKNGSMELLSDLKAEANKEIQFFVENVGLVILQPFLTLFFEKIGVIGEGKNIKDTPLAVHVLHYLATGEEAGFEHNMLFEKFLVGHPLQVPIERNIILSQEIKTEAENLLNSVIRHWEKLNSSSIDALRETFLQRGGKLIDEFPQPRIIVERKTVDILMKDLSWSISILKLPWLDKLIFVEW